MDLNADFCPELCVLELHQNNTKSTPTPSFLFFPRVSMSFFALPTSTTTFLRALPSTHAWRRAERVLHVLLHKISRSALSCLTLHNGYWTNAICFTYQVIVRTLQKPRLQRMIARLPKQDMKCRKFCDTVPVRNGLSTTWFYHSNMCFHRQ